MTREQWLEKAIDKLRPEFKKRCGVKIPKKIKVSISYPRGRSAKKVLGQCLDRSISTGRYFEILIIPTTDKPVAILETLAHELIHAIVGTDQGHKKEFSQCARRFGFLRPWWNTPSSRELKLMFKRIASRMPKFPHKATKLDDKRKKQTTRRNSSVLIVDLFAGLRFQPFF
jgi:hypothetical protein